MNRQAILIAAVSICLPTVAQAQAKSDDNAGVPTITITKLDVTDKTLKLSYKIRNASEQEVWILAGFGRTGVSAEAFMDKDDRTLLIRRRLDVPFWGGDGTVYGRYIRMRPGQIQTESVTTAVPFYPQYGFVAWTRRQARGLEYATRLAIEIGYYSEELPRMIRSVLEKADEINTGKSDDDAKIKYYFRSSLHFNRKSEILRQRDEEVFLPYTYQWFKGEQVLRVIADEVRIPYEEKEDQRTGRESLNIPPCTQIEIHFLPSTFEYFFPFAGQQSLFTRDEKEQLQSEKTTVVYDQQALNAFVNDINKAEPLSGIVCERSVAHVTCYHDDELLVSFPIYNDDSVVVDGRDRFAYYDPLLPGQSLRRLAQQIKPFETRIQCAANLRNLLHRLRLWRDPERMPPVGRSVGAQLASSAKSEMSYPAPSHWCAALVRFCKTIEMGDDEIIGAHICPGTGERKKYLAENDYAVNPNCKYDSPPDTVLLFETKAGWNQHGGPELFTFDNHDPKGGCVLLNDGTVKFIRTKEELQQLQWR